MWSSRIENFGFSIDVVAESLRIAKMHFQIVYISDFLKAQQFTRDLGEDSKSNFHKKALHYYNHFMLFSPKAPFANIPCLIVSVTKLESSVFEWTIIFVL